MASSLETNKILAAVLTAGIVASAASVVSGILYKPSIPEEPAYRIAAASGDESGGGGGEAAAEAEIAVLLASADAAAGEKLAKKCAACHTFEDGGADKIGPHLWGVLGREVGSVPGFAYSDALAGLGGSWDYERLSDFLTSPKGYAPGTKMTFAGVKSGEDRANLIMYLRSLAAAPLPLPEAEADGTAGEAVDSANAEGETTPDSAGDVVEETAQAAADTAAAVVDEAVGAATEAAAGLVDQAKETGAAVADAASQTAGDVAENVAEAASQAAGDAAEMATAAADQVGNLAADVVEGTEAQITKAGEAVSAAAGATVAAVTETVEATAETASGTGDAGGLLAMIAAGDVKDGERVSKKCKACHVFEEGGKNRLGPVLWGVVGRDIASYDGFRYSNALKGLDGNWTYEMLNRFLTSPKTFVPGTKMTFAGVRDDQDRANLILYLRSLSSDPVPLPEG